MELRSGHVNIRDLGLPGSRSSCRVGGGRGRAAGVEPGRITPCGARGGERRRAGGTVLMAGQKCTREHFAVGFVEAWHAGALASAGGIGPYGRVLPRPALRIRGLPLQLRGGRLAHGGTQWLLAPQPLALDLLPLARQRQGVFAVFQRLKCGTEVINHPERSGRMAVAVVAAADFNAQCLT